MSTCEFVVERLQVGPLELLPLIEQASKRLGGDVPCLHLSICGGLIGIFDLLLDAIESKAHSVEVWRPCRSPTTTSASPASACASTGDRVELSLDRIAGGGYRTLARTRLELVAEHCDPSMAAVARMLSP